ncbi:MAG: 2-oxoacid:acceptor oxidoreductase family protein [Lentisphaeria bacterium]|nr:2-oxoacid:acceptor oxidoreductase family protein [Lentisphaeria bacterium]
MNQITNIIAAGLGGQGVLKITDILADVLFRAGYDVKKSEVHGMSQRGGSVSSEVRFGDKVNSPMVPAGEGDVLVVLDASQLEVARPVLKADGVIITPADVPTDQLSNPKALNVMLLGALSARLPQLDETLFLEALERAFPEKLYAANAEMFRLGRKGRG